MKQIKIFFLVLTFPLLLKAQSDASGGMAFLKLGFEARTVATSDLGVASSYSVAPLFYNPAFLKDSSKVVGFTHNNYIQDVSAETFGITFALFGQPLGFSLNTTSIDDIEIRTRPGEATGNFSAHYFEAAFTTAFSLNKFVRLGVSGKYLFEGMFSDEAYGFAFDVGAKINVPVRNLNIGLAVRNIGKMSNLRSTPTELPADFRIGAEYLLPLELKYLDVAVIGGMHKYFEESDLHFNAGTEIVYSHKLALRVGYVTSYDSKGFSAGLGFKWKKLSLDYAFVPFSNNLGNVHFISLSADFNSLF